MSKPLRRRATSRQQRHEDALARPELRRPSDGFARIAPSSPISAAIKVIDPETRRLIDKALAKRDAESAT
jgi:hypothetical protein